MELKIATLEFIKSDKNIKEGLTSLTDICSCEANACNCRCGNSCGCSGGSCGGDSGVGRYDPNILAGYLERN